MSMRGEVRVLRMVLTSVLNSAVKGTPVCTRAKSRQSRNLGEGSRSVDRSLSLADTGLTQRLGSEFRSGVAA
jgi:hypothetical protein